MHLEQYSFDLDRNAWGGRLFKDLWYMSSLIMLLLLMSYSVLSDVAERQIVKQQDAHAENMDLCLPRVVENAEERAVPIHVL